MPRTQVALEITEAAVRAVELTTARTPAVIAAGEVALPPGAAKDSEILDRDAVALALQRLWAETRIASRDVVLGVGNRRILVREHATQLTDPVQIRQALPFEVQDRLPVPVDQAVLDFVPTVRDEQGVRGLLVAAVAEHMEDLVGALEQAKLRASSIDLTAFGYARALAGLTGPERTGLFVGIGEHTTHIVIATGGIPRFVRVVPIDVVEPAAGAGPLAIPAVLDEGDAGEGGRAERRRRAEPGIRRTPPPGAPSLHPDVQAALIDLVGRVRSTVTFYRDRPDAASIDAAWVAGTHAAHPRLLAALEQVIGATVAPVSAVDLVAPSRSLPLAPGVAERLVGPVSLLLGGAR